MSTVTYRLLSLLAPVLRDAGLSGLRTAAESDDPAVVAEGAAAFYAALTESRQKTAADYVRTRLYETETVFSAAAAQGDAADMYARVDVELSALGALAATDCDALRRKLPENARPLFPVWEKGNYTCTAKELAREYAQNGYGAVRARALRFDAAARTFLPIRKVGTQRLSDLKEYTEEKEAAVRNTLAFLEGKPANNVLFYGDRGTGKSSTVHALLNEFAPRGLRLLQIDKSAIPLFPVIKEYLARFPRLRFIVFLDDLSFEEDDGTFAALKAALEGSLATADNARIYVTTNRRHLIKESHAGRAGDDVHRADAVEESLSLFDRFGLVITYIAPDKREYVSILQQILHDRNICISDEDAALAAERYAIKKGGRTPRAAKQLADLIESGLPY